MGQKKLHILKSLFIVLIVVLIMSNHVHCNVALVGSGNWGTAVARRIGLNLEQVDSDSLRRECVKMWVYEEEVHGRKLSEIINEDHENVKYLPNIKLPHNVLAVPDLLESIKGAKMLLFVVPHQFLPGVLKQLKGQVPPSTVCVSLIKGVEFSHGQLRRFSELIRKELHVHHVAVMMGANVASDIAQDHFAETTVGCEDLAVAHRVAALFHCATLHVQVTDDVATVELLGALKNVVALAAGFCDGLGVGSSSKAAVLRRGLLEMQTFCQRFGDASFRPATLMASCGVADLIATCYGGRNRRCAAEFAKQRQHCVDQLNAEGAADLWHRIEANELAGQKLQGVGTCAEVLAFLQDSGYLDEHPDDFLLLRRVHAIACHGDPVDTLLPSSKGDKDHMPIEEL